MSDQDRSSDSVLSLLAGIGLGALVGAMAALLLAPHSGAETRVHIKETADDVLSKLRDSVDDLRTKVDGLVSSTRQTLSRRGDPLAELEAQDPATSTPS